MKSPNIQALSIYGKVLENKRRIDGSNHNERSQIISTLVYEELKNEWGIFIYYRATTDEKMNKIFHNHRKLKLWGSYCQGVGFGLVLVKIIQDIETARTESKSIFLLATNANKSHYENQGFNKWDTEVPKEI